MSLRDVDKRENRFEIVRRLGEGGMGIVFEAFDLEMNAQVALKKLRVMSGQALQSFKQEFRAVHDLEHRNLVRLGELIEQDGEWFFTMELVKGSNFVQHVRANSRASGKVIQGGAPLEASGSCSPQDTSERDQEAPGGKADETRLRAALRELAEAVNVLNKAGKVHRDIKPSNVLVEQNGRVVLLDFGLATEAALDDIASQSQSQALVGTVEYMAPEQVVGGAVGREADWYSVGVVLYEALTGRLPISGRPFDVLTRKRTVRPPSPKDLGIDVAPDLEALCMQLLSIDPKMRPTGPEVLSRLGVVCSGPRAGGRSATTWSRVPVFVGREAETAALVEAFESMIKRQAPEAVLVEGESGIGKSALVRRFTDRVRTRREGVVCLSGRCYEREALPFKAVDGVVDALVRYMMRLDDVAVQGILPRAAAQLGEVFPVMQRVNGVRLAPRMQTDLVSNPHGARAQFFQAMRELFIRLGERHPVVVLVDDIQWADADSLSLLNEMLRPPDAPAMLFLATLRTGIAATSRGVDFRTGLRTGSPIRRVVLSGLTPQEAQDLAERLTLGGEEGEGVDARSVAKEAEGHPLFIYELVAHAVAHKEHEGAGLRLDDVIRNRIEELPELTRRVLELVVVAGAPISQELVAAASSIAASELGRHLGLLRSGRLVQTTGIRGADFARAYHDRIRETVLASLESAALSSVHQRLAEAFEKLGSAENERLAVHWEGAGREDLAADYVRRAAAAAESVLAFDHAAELYRSALEMGSKLGAVPHELRVRLAEALANAGRGREAAEAYLTANVAELSPELSIDLQRRAAAEYLKSGHVDEGLATIRRVLGAIGIGFPRSPRLALISALFRRLLVRLRGLRVGSRRTSPTAMQLQRIDVCWSVANGLAMVDNIRGADFNSRMLLMALRAGDPKRLLFAVASEAVYASSVGGTGEARTRTLLETTDRLARQVGTPYARAWALLVRGTCDYLMSRFADSSPNLDQAEVMLHDQCVGATWELDSVRFYRVIIMFFLGNMGELSRLVPRLVSEALDRGDLYCATNLRLAVGNLAWLVDDNIEHAREVAQAATGAWTARGYQLQHWYALEAMTRLDLYAGDAIKAQERLEAQWVDLSGSMILRIHIVKLIAWELRIGTALAAALSDSARRDQLVAEAKRGVRTLACQGEAWAVSSGHLLSAGVSQLLNDDERVVEHLREAVAGYEAQAMLLHASVARIRLGQVIGGDTGAEMIQASKTWMASQRIRNPERWTAMLSPGFEER